MPVGTEFPPSTHPTLPVIGRAQITLVQVLCPGRQIPVALVQVTAVVAQCLSLVSIAHE
jgi:hypothetical protein